MLTEYSIPKQNLGIAAFCLFQVICLQASELKRIFSQMASSSVARDPNTGPILKLLLFSIALVVLPISLFNASEKGSFDNLYHILFPHLTSNQHLLLSGAVAVLGVNVIVIVYIILAFLEPQAPAELVVDNPLLSVEDHQLKQDD